MVSEALYLCKTIDCDFVPLLSEILGEEWHISHEDIVLFLQQLKDNRATPILLETAQRKFEYLSYDDSYPLARKCTWALADIGTVDSKNALIELSTNKDLVIAGYAQKRLDNWNHELIRKGTSR